MPRVGERFASDLSWKDELPVSYETDRADYNRRMAGEFFSLLQRCLPHVEGNLRRLSRENPHEHDDTMEALLFGWALVKDVKAAIAEYGFGDDDHGEPTPIGQLVAGADRTCATCAMQRTNADGATYCWRVNCPCDTLGHRCGKWEAR